MISAAVWIHVLLLSVLWCRPCDGQCFKKEYRGVCKSPNEDELIRFVEKDCRGLSSLTIEDIPVLRNELSYGSECELPILSIKNSKIRDRLGPFRVMDTLELSYNNITKLDFINPTSVPSLKFVMSHNLIEYLDGNYLGQFGDLRMLDLSHNRIRNVTVVFSTALQSLNLSSNMLEEIGDVFKVSRSLRVIDLSSNKLKIILANIFGGLDHLEYLNLSQNEIHTIENKDPLGSHYYYGVTVDLSRNRLNNLDVFFLNGGFTLSTIILDENDFESLDVMSNRTENLSSRSFSFRRCGIKQLASRNFNGLKLRELDLAFNSIKIIPPLAFDGLEVRNLSLAHNKIQYLNASSFSGVTGLERLNLSFNTFRTVGELVFANLTLKELDLSHCQLSKVPDLPSGKFLRRIDLSHNSIWDIKPGTLSDLDFLDLSHNEINYIKRNAFSGKNIKVLNISGNGLKTLAHVFNGSLIGDAVFDDLSLWILNAEHMEGLNAASSLSIQNSGIKELDPNVFKRSESLLSLSLDGNSILSIETNRFLYAKRLQSFSITRNPLEGFSRDAFPKINEMLRFNLTFNGKIRERNFVNLAGLKELRFFDSNITQFQEGSFEGLENLEVLVFSNTTISEIRPGAFNGLSSLPLLNLSSLFSKTVLKSRTFVGLKTLLTLDLSDNRLEKIEMEAFAGLRGLVSLNLTRNGIKTLAFGSFRGLRFLKTLDLSQNRLDLDKDKTGVFSDLPELTHLDLGRNKISTVKTGVFSGLRNLKSLNLTANYLKTVDEYAFYPLERLEILDLNKNSLGYNKDDGFFVLDWLSENSLSLKAVGISRNKLTCMKTLALLKMFRKKSIDYRKLSISDFKLSNLDGIECIP